MTRWIVLCIGFGLGPATAVAASLADVTSCMRENVPVTVRVQSFVMQTSDRTNAQRRMAGRLYATRQRELMRVNLRLDEPPDMRSATYLMRETDSGRDEMFVFLPALNRVRRIVGGTRDNPMFGTDFSYNDLQQVHNAFSGDETLLLPPERLDDRPVHRLEVLREGDADSRYTRMAAWVDEATCVALQVDFFEGDKHVKRMISNPASLQQAQGHWYAAETTMSDLVAGSSTLLSISDVSSAETLPERLFSPTLFYLGN